TAARRCPGLLFVRPRFDVYRAVSQQIRQVFHSYSDLVEPLSLDEAYLDVTQDKRGIGSATQTAELIRAAIREQTQLTASAGVSYNKFLAKIASDQNKPDGVFVIRPQEGAQFVADLPVRRFYGVGPRTAERMERLGIGVGADLREKDMDFLYTHFGKSARYLYHAARGLDNRAVKPDRVRKSVGAERTFSEDLVSPEALHAALDEIIDTVWQRIEKNGVAGRTVTLKVKYADFRQITRSKSGAGYVTHMGDFADVARDLLAQLLPVPRGVRLLGVTLSQLAQRQSLEVRETAASAPQRQRAFDF
ncbi:MAG: DNA polymerase IV, partial [Halioglobus sp.]|nr:DNA polymerase IV [Halioglobus sp.]